MAAALARWEADWTRAGHQTSARAGLAARTTTISPTHRPIVGQVRGLMNPAAATNVQPVPSTSQGQADPSAVPPTVNPGRTMTATVITRAATPATPTTP